ncbi:hypothetical protein QZH41_012052, partial [Actinostola sp. cb2023]
VGVAHRQRKGLGPADNSLACLQKSEYSSGLSEQGASSGQQNANNDGQSTSSVSERNDTNSHSDDNELKDSDMSRLQSLLEARGVPPHLFGSLGPRMHQLLHRASSNSSSSKAQQLLQGIQSSDEGQQLQAVIEMCQLLVMGNEESLAGFPVKQAVPALINLLNKEQKFELVNHACRALTYLMESLPRSTMVVMEAIPAFLEKVESKLQYSDMYIPESIECMDVAEQCLTALDMLSKRHGKAILQAGGMSTTCLLYLDFFSISAQRSALAIAANCCSSVGPDDFHYVADAVEILSSRLQIQDKKSVESCCLAFSRLVDSFQNDKKHLKDLAAHGLLTSIQQLLMIFPPIISTGTFVMVLRMLSLLCANCPDLAVDLIKNNIVETLQFLLFGSVEQDVQDNVELSSDDDGGGGGGDDDDDGDGYDDGDDDGYGDGDDDGDDDDGDDDGDDDDDDDGDDDDDDDDDDGDDDGDGDGDDGDDDDDDGYDDGDDDDDDFILYEVVMMMMVMDDDDVNNMMMILGIGTDDTGWIGDVFRGKRRSKRNPRTKEKCQSVMEPDLKKQTELTHLTKSGNIPTTSSLPPHTKPSFFSSLTTSRWNAKASTSSLSSSADGLPRVDVNNLNNTLQALSTSRMSDNKEKIRAWINVQAIKFCATYFDEEQGKSHPALDVLQKLTTATENLATNVSNTCTLCLIVTVFRNKDDLVVLKAIRGVVSDSEEGASPFEILHSGLVPQLLKYLTSQTIQFTHPLEDRLKRFLQVFMDFPNDPKKPPLTALVAKLHSCINQVEQFPVKVHDAPTGTSGIPGSRGSQALRFFSTHQIKCHLQRHPDCKTLKQWKGGPVKIDPLALVQSADDLDASEDDGSDDEIDESLALELQGESMPRHHLEVMLGDRILPYNMTVYQAVKQYGQNDEDKDTDEDQGVLGRPSIWVGQHTIWFRPLIQSSDSPTGNSKIRSGSRSSSKMLLKKSCKDDTEPSISQSLTNCLPTDTAISDPSIEVICLMRILHVLNNNWPLLFESNQSSSLVSNSEFMNAKLSAKILRQLQDPIAVMTGNYPSWIEELPKKCPFLFPFECRQKLFFSTAFDRERAMSKLQESVPDLINTEMSDRVAPRLDRKKNTVSRKDIITQAEKIIQELGSSQSILEIQYEGEVGTGLGPTLEFYTLVSKEFQNSIMEMWRGTAVAPPANEGAEDGAMYINAPSGLFPAPVAKNTKAATLTKLRSKFRFLGRFVGRAVLDFRMIDIPLSQAYYKWMLGLENRFDYRDLELIDPVLSRSIGQLQGLVRQKKRLEEDASLTPESLQLAIENLTLDGSSVEDLGLDFILPGYPSIELKKNGRNIPVTIHNLNEYIKLVVHWTFIEGVEKQFQAFQEGFDSVFSLVNLNGFSPHEMDLLLCGSGVDKWETKHLIDNCRPDHGYTHDSRAIKYLFEVLSSYDKSQQRLFLQFVTGSPRLPVGGFRSLNPPLTIVRKTFEPPLSADNYLPSVMTCVNYLKLPDYTTKKIMEDKLTIAGLEGQRSFHLS